MILIKKNGAIISNTIKKNMYLFLTALFCFIKFSGFAQTYPKFVQLNKEGYELSAICQDDKGQIIVSSDEGDIDFWDTKTNNLAPIQHPQIVGKDFEALDFYEGKLWYAVEQVYRKIESISPGETSCRPHHSISLNGCLSDLIPKTDNYSIEAFAIDSINKKLYFAKELNKRAIFYYNLDNLNDTIWKADEVRVLDVYRGMDEPPYDITDMKLEYNEKNEPVLYLLERYERQIRAYNISTQKSKITSFKKIVCDSTSSLFSKTGCECPKCYGKAEALLVTENEFWIGFDNNGKSINEAFAKNRGYYIQGKKPDLLKGKKPILLKIER